MDGEERAHAYETRNGSTWLGHRNTTLPSGPTIPCSIIRELYTSLHRLADQGKTNRASDICCMVGTITDPSSLALAFLTLPDAPVALFKLIVSNPKYRFV